MGKIFLVLKNSAAMPSKYLFCIEVRPRGLLRPTLITANSTKTINAFGKTIFCEESLTKQI